MLTAEQFKGVFWGILSLLTVATACSSSSRDIGSAEPATIIPATATIEATPTFPPLDPTFAARLAEQRNPAVPDLPFAENPDPSLCGIPIAWGLDESAWLTGFYQGELLQADVLLYDSHLRLDITGEAPHGAEVKILLYQENPTLDYYLVKVVATGTEGWVPEPLVSFEPVAAFNDQN